MRNSVFVKLTFKCLTKKCKPNVIIRSGQCDTECDKAGPRVVSVTQNVTRLGIAIMLFLCFWAQSSGKLWKELSCSSTMRIELGNVDHLLSRLYIFWSTTTTNPNLIETLNAKKLNLKQCYCLLKYVLHYEYHFIQFMIAKTSSKHIYVRKSFITFSNQTE